MLTPRMHKLGEQAAVAHVCAHTHMALMLPLALKGKAEHLRTIRPPELQNKSQSSLPGVSTGYQKMDDGWMDRRKFLLCFHKFRKGSLTFCL